MPAMMPDPGKALRHWRNFAGQNLAGDQPGLPAEQPDERRDHGL